MKKVAAYIRVSTEGQLGDDKYGLEAQRSDIVKYCAEHDMEIIEWFSDEGVPARSSGQGSTRSRLERTCRIRRSKR